MVAEVHVGMHVWVVQTGLDLLTPENQSINRYLQKASATQQPSIHIVLIAG